MSGIGAGRAAYVIRNAGRVLAPLGRVAVAVVGAARARAFRIEPCCLTENAVFTSKAQIERVASGLSSAAKCD